MSSTITLSIPRPLGSERRNILRSMLQDRKWTGQTIGYMSVEQLVAALASLGVTQEELDSALNQVQPPVTIQGVPVVQPQASASVPVVVASHAADPVSGEAETLRRQIGALVFDGNITGADAVVNNLLRRVMAAEAEAKALRAQSAVTPVIEPEPQSAISGSKTAGELFGLPRAKFASWKLATYTPTAETPAIDSKFRWDAKVTHALLAVFRAQGHGDTCGYPALIGPPGTGKSTWAKQFAAVTGRPFFEVDFSDTVEANDLIGTIDPTYQDGLRWKDGIFTKAIRTPGAVILLDEIGAVKPSTGVAFNNILQNRSLTIAETTERVDFAPGVLIIGTSNDLLGRTSAGMQHFAGLHRQNSAFSDRFAVQVWLGYPTKATEVAMLRDHVQGLSKTLALLMVETAHLSRVKLGNDEVSYGIGFRRLLGWGVQLAGGLPAVDAWTSGVLHFMPEGDHEVYRELAKAQGVLDDAVIDAARQDTKVAARDPNAPGSEFDVVTDTDTDTEEQEEV